MLATDDDLLAALAVPDFNFDRAVSLESEGNALSYLRAVLRKALVRTTVCVVVDCRCHAVWLCSCDRCRQFDPLVFSPVADGCRVPFSLPSHTHGHGSLCVELIAV